MQGGAKGAAGRGGKKTAEIREKRCIHEEQHNEDAEVVLLDALRGLQTGAESLAFRACAIFVRLLAANLGEGRSTRTKSSETGQILDKCVPQPCLR